MRQLEGEEKLDAMKQLDGNEAAVCRGETRCSEVAGWQ